MRISAKLGLTALVAAVLLAAALSTASARSLSVSNQNIRVTWSNIEFVGTVTIRCQVTLEGSYHNGTISKVRGTLIAAISRATVKTESCTNARVRAEGLPWHITYEGFRGTLPNMTEVFLLLREALLSLERVLGSTTECRFGTSSDNITSTGAINGARENTNLIPLEGRSTISLLEARNETVLIRCPASGQLRAGTEDGIMRLLASTTTRIRVTLI
ncbi:MAG TPA: hypothetical protein VFS59_07335 [Gemmatimonadaceae bacterium]|nr:hypothetical protein [Gemmatimonadaceae bacterium]